MIYRHPQRQAQLLHRDTLTHLPGHPPVRAMAKQNVATRIIVDDAGIPAFLVRGERAAADACPSPNS